MDIGARLDFHAAAAAYRMGRSRGSTVRSLVDCLIAVVAARHGATLLHRDRDFDVLDSNLPELRTISLSRLTEACRPGATVPTAPGAPIGR